MSVVMKWALAVGIGCLLSPTRAWCGPAEAKVLFQNVCTQCHGQSGQGKTEVQAPAIAALPAWYVQLQLQNYRSGLRGGEGQGTAGLLMSATAKALPAEQLAPLAQYIEKLPLHPAAGTAATADADAAAGKLLYEERCMECHRYNATGEMVFRSPPLIGLQDWYLLTQLSLYKTGRRGVSPTDVNGAKMVFASQFIESASDAKNVVAYLMTLNPAPQGAANDDSAVQPAQSGDPFDQAPDKR
jgi:cytochrome c553